MITLILFAIISVLVLAIALSVLSIGGTIFTVFAADLIVAVGFIWLFYKLLNRKKKGE